MATLHCPGRLGFRMHKTIFVARSPKSIAKHFCPLTWPGSPASIHFTIAYENQLRSSLHTRRVPGGTVH
eukprot:3270748-Rhodomonas_salina.1